MVCRLMQGRQQEHTSLLLFAFSSRNIFKTYNLEISCKSLTQSNSPRTGGSRISTARRSCHRACSGCRTQPPPGTLHPPRRWKHHRGVAADNMPALPREDLGTEPFYAQRVQTPNHKYYLLTVSHPTTPAVQYPALPTATPNLRSQRHLVHPRRLQLNQTPSRPADAVVPDSQGYTASPNQLCGSRIQDHTTLQ